MKSEKQIIGAIGESYAKEFLMRSDYKILQTNWRFKKSEIDIICVSPEGLLVFVEVKTRSTISGRAAEEKVDAKKQEMIVKGALAYIEAYAYESEIRFDVITIQLDSEESYDIQHFEDSFFPGKW